MEDPVTEYTKDNPQLPDPYGFGLTKIKGVTGTLIWIAQALAGRPSRYQHAFLLIPGAYGGTYILEAMPNGARIRPVMELWDSKKGRWNAEFFYPPLTDFQKRVFGNFAARQIGTPYSFLDYLSLFLLHFYIRPPWVKAAVKASEHMICSQLVDYVYKKSAVRLFDDGRFEGDVMPADLHHLAIEKNWPRWTLGAHPV